MSSLHATYVNSPYQQLMPPDAEAWAQTGGLEVSLEPTPIESQPSAYVQTSWQDRPYGEIRSLLVKAICNDETTAVHLSWKQPEPNRSINDTNVYADACAVLFPENGRDAVIETMGSPESPVIGWHWRAGAENPEQIRATGISTVERSSEHQVLTQSRWSDGQWQVVLMRLGDQSPPHFADIVPIGFALWSGHNSERAGLKAYTPQFHALILEQRK